MEEEERESDAVRGLAVEEGEASFGDRRRFAIEMLIGDVRDGYETTEIGFAPTR